MQRGTTVPDSVLAEVFSPLALLDLPAIFNTFSYISLILSTISLKISATLTQKQKFRLRALPPDTLNRIGELILVRILCRLGHRLLTVRTFKFSCLPSIFPPSFLVAAVRPAVLVHGRQIK